MRGRHRLLARWIGTLAGAFALAAAAVTPARADTPTTVIGGFESSSAVDSVKVADPSRDRVRWSSDIVSSGAHSLEFDVAAGTGTAQIDLTAGSSFDRLPWAAHHLISWDVMSDSPVQYLGQVTFKDAAGHSWSHAYFVPPFGIHAYNGLVSGPAGGGVDVDHITEIDMTAPRQGWAVRIWVDSMRLIDAASDDQTPYVAAATPGLIAQMRLVPGIDDAEAALRAAQGRIPPPDTPANDALRTQAASLMGSLTTLRQQAAQTGLDLAGAQALSQQLQTMTQRVRRLGGVIDTRRAEPGNDQYGTVAADSMSLVYPNDRPCACSPSPSTLALARGETQSEQIAVIPYAQDLSGMSVDVASVTGPADGGVTVTADPVGFLDVTPTASYNGTRDTSGWYTGWTPDPIRTDIHQVDVPAGAYQPYWITVHAADGARDGAYQVTLAISGANLQAENVRLTVQVWPFTLPARPDLTTSFELEPTILGQLYGATDPAQATARVRQYQDFLETYDMEPGNIYADTPPSVADLEYVKSRWGLRHFNVLYLNYTQVNLGDPSSWPALIDSWVSTISAAMAQYQSAGLAGYAYVYGFDESTAAYFPIMKQALTAIKQRFPDLPIMSTVRDGSMGPDSGLTGLVNIWAPQMDLYQQSSADTAHARGDQVYWYPDISTGHPYPNWFNGYPPIDTRVLMGPMSHQSGVDGVLYYKVDRWMDHPLLEDGIYSSWNPATLDTTAGDGSLFYPGRDGPLPSMRLANFRDGMQDYDLLDLLSTRIAQASSTTPPAELATARTLLAGDAVVRSRTDYTEDPASYRDWRAQVAQAITRLTR